MYAMYVMYAMYAYFQALAEHDYGGSTIQGDKVAEVTPPMRLARVLRERVASH